MKPYEVMEHTADVGLRVFGRDLSELFSHSARGLFDLITDLDQVLPKASDPRDVGVREFVVQLEAEEVGELLLKWLRELLFAFFSQRLVLYQFCFESINERELKAVARGLEFDPGRHDQKCEVKAVTYHGFKINKRQSGWVAEVIFDV